MTVVWMFNIKFVRKVTKDSCFTSFSLKDMVSGLSPLLFRKLSNPDIFSPTGKAKLQRQLSQDDCKLRRGSLASSLSGKYRTFFFFFLKWNVGNGHNVLSMHTTWVQPPEPKWGDGDNCGAVSLIYRDISINLSS